MPGVRKTRIAFAQHVNTVNKNIINALVDAGAVLTLGQTFVLLARFELLGERRAFYFEAGNDSEFGGHVLYFAEMKVYHDRGVGFLDSRGPLTAYLSPIADAVDADEAAQYEAGFRDWQKRMADAGERRRFDEFYNQVKAEMTEGN